MRSLPHIDNETKTEIASEFAEGYHISIIAKKHGVSIFQIEQVIRQGFRASIVLCENLTKSAKRQNTH